MYSNKKKTIPTLTELILSQTWMHDHLLQGNAAEIRKYFQMEILDVNEGYIVEKDFYDLWNGSSIAGKSLKIYNILTNNETRNMMFYSSTKNAGFTLSAKWYKEYEKFYVGIDVKEESIDIVSFAVPVRVNDEFDGDVFHYKPKPCIIDGLNLKRLLTQFPIFITQIDIVTNIDLVLESIK